jgi:hypothetical protein
MPILYRLKQKGVKGLILLFFRLTLRLLGKVYAKTSLAELNGSLGDASCKRQFRRRRSCSDGPQIDPFRQFLCALAAFTVAVDQVRCDITRQ